MSTIKRTVKREVGVCETYKFPVLRHRITIFSLLILDGLDIMISNSAKYLGVIFERKLSWKKDIEERMKKRTNVGTFVQR